MIKKRLSDDRLLLIRTEHYPYRASSEVLQVGKQSHRVLVGVGGNIGDVPRRFEYLYWYLKHSRKVTLLKSGPILKNPPFGYLEQADFYNTVILLATSLTPVALLQYLLLIERRFGRRRSIKDGPRTLDLDILFYDMMKIDRKNLKIPHPDWMNRDSVLIPLKYLKGNK